MSAELRDLLAESKRLLKKRESDRADFEAGLRESKQALTRFDKTLAVLRDILAQRP
jgi:outer membrane murein-binding lipoprotein Lpp